MNDLVAVGETMALLTTPRIGRLRDMTSLGLSIAGAESNVAIGVARLGHRAAWIGRVGDDELGAGIVERLRREGVDVGGVIRDPEAQTAVMFKERRTAGVLRVTYYRKGYAGSRLAPGDLDEEVIAGAAVVHVTGISLGLSPSAGDAVRRAVEIAHVHGGLVSFDLNYRAALWPPTEAAAALEDMASRADVVFAGEEELAMLEGGTGGTGGTGGSGGSGGARGAAGSSGETAALADRAARRLVGESGRQVVVKLGAAGARCVDGEGVHFEPAVAVDAVDVVGAGDAFVAGYLAAVLDGVGTAGRLRLGCATGAFAVSVVGDWEGLPTRDDLALLDHRAGTTLR